MRRCIPAAVLIFILAACHGRGPADETVVDTSTEWREGTIKEQSNYGTWAAKVEHSAAAGADSLTLELTGTVDLARPKATVILIKQADTKNRRGELLLNLSKRPRKTMEQPATVRYTESLMQRKQYSSIRIMYGRDTVAVITTIAGTGSK